MISNEQTQNAPQQQVIVQQDSNQQVTPEQQPTIKFDESQNREMKDYNFQHNEKITQKPLTRQSTGQSSMDFDTKSVRSVLMNKMNLVKKRRQSVDNSERVEGPPYHTMDLDTVNQLLKSDLEDGMSETSIDERRAQYSYNEMEGEGGVNPVQLMIKQFTNIMVVILLIAMVSYDKRHTCIIRN